MPRADAGGWPFTRDPTWFTAMGDPADQYGTWAHGVSWMPAAPGRPNLRLPVATAPVRQDGRLVERDLEGFLRATGTEAFLAANADTAQVRTIQRAYGIARS